jgi:pimeloyl-ACP methyl ester carboxylesterase
MVERILVKTSDGEEVSVRVEGEGDAVLVVHGWMMTGAVWDTMFLSLDGRGRKFIVPDQRGTGASTRTGTDYSLAQHAQDLVAVLDATNTKSAVVIGHSMGGQLALYLAAHYPERVRAVMALNPVPPEGLPLPPDAAGLFRTSAGDRGKQGTILGLACKSLSEEEKNRLLDLAGSVCSASIEGAFDAWVAGGFDDKLGAVTAPVLVLATDDPFLPPEFLKASIVSKIARGRLAVLHGAGHYPQCERPQETAALIEAFLTAT